VELPVHGPAQSASVMNLPPAPPICPALHAATAPAGHGHVNWFVNGAVGLVKRLQMCFVGKGSAGSGPPENWFPCTWKLPIFFQALSDSGRVPVRLLSCALKVLMSTKAPMASGRMPPSSKPQQRRLHDSGATREVGGAPHDLGSMCRCAVSELVWRAAKRAGVLLRCGTHSSVTAVPAELQ
jgi:hypothetical protein